MQQPGRVRLSRGVAVDCLALLLLGSTHPRPPLSLSPRYVFYVVCSVSGGDARHGVHIPMGFYSQERHRGAGSEHNLNTFVVWPPYQKQVRAFRGAGCALGRWVLPSRLPPLCARLCADTTPAPRLTRPPSRLQGLGTFLIDLSYKLLPGGGPERPLSDLGEIAYRKYWRTALVRALLAYRKDNVSPTLIEVGQHLGFRPDDLNAAIDRDGFLRPSNGEFVLDIPYGLESRTGNDATFAKPECIIGHTVGQSTVGRGGTIDPLGVAG